MLINIKHGKRKRKEKERKKDAIKKPEREKSGKGCQKERKEQ